MAPIDLTGTLISQCDQRASAELDAYFDDPESSAARAYLAMRRRLLRNGAQLVDKRLLRDSIALRRLNLNPTVIDVRSFVGDTHRGGRAVCALHLYEGPALYYKPRRTLTGSLRCALATLASAGVVDGVSVPWGLERESYSWSAAVSGQPQDSIQHLADLLALTHVFGSVDMHDENVCFSLGRYTIVDDECFVAPSAGPQCELATKTELVDFYSWSLERTGVMRRVLRAVASERQRDQMLERFGSRLDAIARFLSSQEGERMMASFARHRVRFVLRPTDTYRRCLRSLDGVDWRERSLHLLNQTPIPFSVPGWVVRAELDALKAGDIPYFDMPVGGRAVTGDSGRPWDVPFLLTPLQRLEQAAKMYSRRANVYAAMSQLDSYLGHQLGRIHASAISRGVVDSAEAAIAEFLCAITVFVHADVRVHGTSTSRERPRGRLIPTAIDAQLLRKAGRILRYLSEDTDLAPEARSRLEGLMDRVNNRRHEYEANCLKPRSAGRGVLAARHQPRPHGDKLIGAETRGAVAWLRMLEADESRHSASSRSWGVSLSAAVAYVEATAPYMLGGAGTS